MAGLSESLKKLSEPLRKSQAPWAGDRRDNKDGHQVHTRQQHAFHKEWVDREGYRGFHPNEPMGETASLNASRNNSTWSAGSSGVMPFDKSAMTSRTNRASNQSARTGRSIVLTERSQEIVSLTKQREDLQAQLAAIESTLHEKERVQLQLGKSRPHRPFAMLPRSARRFVEEEE
jgi:hypothetical protein